MCELLQCVNSTAQYVNSNNCLLPKAKRVKKKKQKKQNTWTSNADTQSKPHLHHQKLVFIYFT